ncbi:MAG TPA: ABC transporter transmembrane domain-containing protein, partial [Ktedonobacterales bacterium]|nr:ABC transporter transmembrane domain-containing protein [Ktedonobacterales bacterium]
MIVPLPQRYSARGRWQSPKGDDDRLTPKKVFTALASLPRVLQLVWKISPVFTATLGVLNIAQGFLPATTAFIAGTLVDAVVRAIQFRGAGGTSTLVLWLVVAQFGIQGISSLLSTLSNIVQQLLQERVSQQVQLMVMEKANTLDLSFFEDATFYDALQRAQSEAASRPTGMISQTFGLGQALVILLSMVIVLSQLTWWMALVALIAPLPAFFASMRYGWWGYQMMRRQSPLRREMSYYNNLLTTDVYNKEIKLFTLGDFFIQLYRTLSNRFYTEARGIIVPRYLASFAWGLGSLLVNGLIYLYIALQTVAGHITLGRLTFFSQAALSVGSSFQSLLNGISATY